MPCVVNVGRINVKETVECLLCKGNHAARKTYCPKRVRETEIVKVRCKKRHTCEEVGKTRYGARKEAKKNKSVLKNEEFSFYKDQVFWGLWQR